MCVFGWMQRSLRDIILSQTCCLLVFYQKGLSVSSDVLLHLVASRLFCTYMIQVRRCSYCCWGLPLSREEKHSYRTHLLNFLLCRQGLELKKFDVDDTHVCLCPFLCG